MIANCGKDEFGSYSGGTAGDQSGGEYAIINWYNRPWNCVLRHPKAEVRSEIAKLARAAANNNNIGYDQSERMTFWNQLVKVGYDPAAITTPCEADCSSSTMSIVKAVGYRLNDNGLKAVSAALTTYGMRSALRVAGFDVLTDSKYLTSASYLVAGDILLNDSSHTAINLDNGGYADTSSGVPGGTAQVGDNVDWSKLGQIIRGDEGTTSEVISAVKVGDVVIIVPNASWWSGSSIPAWVKGKRWIVASVSGLRAVLGKSEDGFNNINSPISTKYLSVIKAGDSVAAPIKPPSAEPNNSGSAGEKIYTVQRGDSLWKIAVTQLGNGTRWKEIQQLNNLPNDRIYVGQKLKMP